MPQIVLATATSPTHERILPLREWLDGHWAIVMSHPDDFAPRPTTPIGYAHHIADAVLASGVKPIAFEASLEQVKPNWLDHTVNDDAVVVLDRSTDRIVDLAERMLSTKLATLKHRFVVFLDERGRCRRTMEYREESLQSRRCTISALLEVVAALRGTGAIAAKRTLRSY